MNSKTVIITVTIIALIVGYYIYNTKETDNTKGTDNTKPITDKDIESAKKELGFGLNKINVLIIGTGGSGKSSFIKYLLGHNKQDLGENIPTIGKDEPTKLKPYQYSINNLEYVIWDSPGIGTVAFPGHNYRQFYVYAFDLVIILYSDRIDQYADALLKLCHSANQPVILVRNKMDKVLDDISNNEQNMSEDGRIEYAKQVVIDETEKYTDISIPVFMISVQDMFNDIKRFDEDKLMEYLHFSR